MSFIHQRREKATSQDGELTGPLGTRFLLKFSTSTDSQQSKILKSASQEAELGWRKNFSSNPSTFPGRAHQYAFWIVLVKRFLVLPNSAVIMPMFKTAFNGYSVKFSPFLENRIAVATSQNFGIIGTGRQYILDLTPNGMVQVAAFDTPDGLYDCAWSEVNENILVSASGDGSIKIWDLTAPPMANPVRSHQEHAHEVASVDWNMVRKDSFLSSSWDDTIRLWTLDDPRSLRVFAEHSYCVYNATWNPRHADIFASASGDCTLRIWDVREPRSTYIIPGHEMEILACDWNKYNEFMLASGSVDKSIKLWDVRNPRQEVTRMLGHTYAVRRLKFSPHQESLLASCSYDMTVCLWDYKQPEDALLARLNHHTEFAVGIDVSALVEGLLASTAWDESVYVWQLGLDPRAA